MNEKKFSTQIELDDKRKKRNIIQSLKLRIRICKSKERRIEPCAVQPYAPFTQRLRLIFDKIMRLAVNVKLINGEQIKKFLKSYDDMNDFLLSESYIKT